MNDDFFIFNRKKFQGVTSKVGTTYTLASRSSKWPEQVTFTMEKTKNLLIEIAPLKSLQELLCLQHPQDVHG